MKKFKVKIVKKLRKFVEVEAESWEDADRIVRTQYNNGDIVVDSDDCVGVKFVIDGVEGYQ